jgi:hypothetical protein
VGENTEFIRSELRMYVLADQQRSRRYLSASVRSVIDLQRYFRLDAEGNVKARYLKGRTSQERANTSLKEFIRKEKRERGRIIEKAEPFPLYTRYENISPQRAADDMRGVVGVEKQLRSKHEPSTGQRGTVAADQYLFQLLPKQYVQQQREAEAREKQRRQQADKQRRQRAAKKAAATRAANKQKAVRKKR